MVISNHNMDPAVVGSDQFGILWSKRLLGTYRGYTEQIFSQPLVYTPGDGTQYVYVATTMNIVYKINAKTGDIVLSRTLHVPFLVSDLDGCIDINPLVGVTVRSTSASEGLCELRVDTHA
jgi:outer membrane protein assembly factor BamB